MDLRFRGLLASLVGRLPSERPLLAATCSSRADSCLRVSVWAAEAPESEPGALPKAL